MAHRYIDNRPYRRNIYQGPLDLHNLRDQLRGGPLEEQPARPWLPWVVIVGYLLLLALIVHFSTFIDLF